MVVFGMISPQFFEKISLFPNLKPHFIGVYALDNLPKVIKEHKFLICNTDTQSGPGKHWFCLLKISKSEIECFDSLGIDNKKKQILFNQLKHFKVKKVKFNVTAVQLDSSNTCGLFVLYFLIHRNYNKDVGFAEFLNSIFTSCKETNENNVLKFSNEQLTNG